MKPCFFYWVAHGLQKNAAYITWPCGGGYAPAHAGYFFSKRASASSLESQSYVSQHCHSRALYWPRRPEPCELLFTSILATRPAPASRFRETFASARRPSKYSSATSRVSALKQSKTIKYTPRSIFLLSPVRVAWTRLVFPLPEPIL